ncbi:GDP-mannose 4,6-dehydratase [uncultured Parasutterella sp.]|uniref:GDP-mannose 4,6-dehydratase n=2 Tax=uncultured Parasutterella sp. TaxID=1263098 RepID=UPI0025E21EC3|nr:GDP-mannose 4,6-dehydratase [uncultured Parasutterella sp.]
MNRILLTGFSGFTGKYILQSATNFGVDIFCFSEDGTPNSKSINLLDYRAVLEKVKETKPTSVIHLAAISHVQHEPASDFYSVNIGGTRNLLQALSELPSEGLINTVFASSANIYGNSKQVVLNETTPLKPVNDYGLSKKGMEELLYLWREKIPISITRPFNYTGRGQTENFLIPKIVEAFKLKKQRLELGNLEVSRDFSDVRFIANAYLTLATQKSGFRILNLCSGNLVSIREIVSVCTSLTGHRLEVVSNPNFRRRNEILKLKGDTTQMVKYLGYRSAYSIKDTIGWMLAK